MKKKLLLIFLSLFSFEVLSSESCRELIKSIYGQSVRTSSGRLTPSQIIYSPLKPLTGRLVNEEERLLNSDIVSDSIIKIGEYSKNQVYKVTLKNGVKAIWKPHREVWYSNYRTEVLAYELSALLEFNIVPATIVKDMNGVKGSLQLFIVSDEYKELNPGEFYLQQLFDFIIEHTDRAVGHNYLIDENGRIVSIDNGLSLSGTRVASNHDLSSILKGIDEFSNTDSGRIILKNIRENINSEKFFSEVKDYLGNEEDAKNLLERMRFILLFSEYGIENYDKFVEHIFKDPSFGDASLGAIASMAKSFEEIQEVIQSEKVGNYALMVSASAVRKYVSQPDIADQLLLSIYESNKAKEHALESIAYALGSSDYPLSSTKYLLGEIVNSNHVDSGVIQFVVYAISKKYSFLGKETVVELIQDIDLKLIDEYSSKKLKEIIRMLDIEVIEVI